MSNKHHSESDKLDELSLIKSNIRKEKCAKRRAIAPDILKERSDVICKKILESDFYKSAKNILIYNAINGEVMLDMIADESEGEKRIAYPVCIDKTTMEAYIPNNKNAYIKGAYGIKEPDLNASSRIEPDKLDLIIAPCTAFDKDCKRLGMGAGYYDRYLKRCTKARVIAAAFEMQKVDSVPCNEHDISLDAVFTEEKIYII